MITRQDYIKESESLHTKYYSQFVTQMMKTVIWDKFGNHLIKSKDKYFNDILTLTAWDRMSYLCKDAYVSKLLKECGEGWSLSSCVCILKEAGRIALEQHLTRNEESKTTKTMSKI